MNDLAYLIERSRCPAAEQHALAPLVITIADLGHRARLGGLACLENEIEGQQNLVLQTGLRMLADHCTREIIYEILTNLIISSGKQGRELLADLVCLVGVLSIREGENPRIIRLKLTNLIGKELYLKEELYEY